MSKTVLFQIIQFSISTQFSSIWPIDRTVSGATNLGQTGPGSDANEGLLCIPESFSITGVQPSDCLVSYPGYSLEESYTSAEIQSVYSIAQANLVTHCGGGGLTPLQRCSQRILQPQPIGPDLV